MATWTILISGYGGFLFKGTEVEAEEMRSHKARWEGGIGKKRRATRKEIKADKADQCWNHPRFNNHSAYRCQCSDMDCMTNAYERLGVEA